MTRAQMLLLTLVSCFAPRPAVGFYSDGQEKGRCPCPRIPLPQKQAALLRRRIILGDKAGSK
jgi:hypothetical protein